MNRGYCRSTNLPRGKYDRSRIDGKKSCCARRVRFNLTCGHGSALVIMITLFLALDLIRADLDDYSASNLFQIDFPSFDLNSVINLTLYGDAQPTAQGVLQLTKNTADQSLQSSVGRAFYSSPIQLWTSSTTNDTLRDLASFTTVVTLSIQNFSADYFGDGLTFLMSSTLSPPPLNSKGGALGLVNDSFNGNISNHIVAVEFDTFPNSWDIDDNHVGLDVNGYISVKSESLYAVNVQLKGGQLIYAWIDYNGNAKQLSVYASYNDNKPNVSQPSLLYDVDLSQYLLQEIYVGFSASTGGNTELHTIHSWNFSATSSSQRQPQPPSPAPLISRSKNKNSMATEISLCIVLPLLGIGLAAWILLYINRKRSRQRVRMISSAINLADLEYGPRKFKYRELSAATNNFSDDLVLGRGGFGSVYKGVLQVDGAVVAVKRISENSKQGEREFLAEVSIIGRLRHRNLVPLLGWCHERSELLLVYEFMPNGSLDRVLFTSSKAPSQDKLDWNRRYEIICGLASALVYLHEEWEQQVVHRDVKASNVMLDANFSARLGDFGLARLTNHHQNPQTTAAAGTMGYLAPEVTQTGKATSKSDVYSFGIVALEVVSGRKPIDDSLSPSETVLLEWVWQLHSEGRITEAADEILSEKGKDMKVDWKQVRRLLELGLACSHPDPNSRPPTRQVLQVLKGDVGLPPLPQSKPVLTYAHLFGSSFASRAANYSATASSSNKSTASDAGNGHDQYPPADYYSSTISSATTRSSTSVSEFSGSSSLIYRDRLSGAMLPR